MVCTFPETLVLKTRSGCPWTVDTNKIISLVYANSHLTVREIQEILVARKRCGASQKRRLCEQNGYVGATRTKRQEPAAALGCMRLAAWKDKEHFFLSPEAPRIGQQKGMTFHHDPRPYTSLRTREKLLKFSWDVLPYLPYSPDLALSDYHLFCSLQISLEKNFPNPDAIKIHLEWIFAEKSKTLGEGDPWSV